jgi:hypothetical protein
MRVELFPWESTLLAALLAFPSGLIFDVSRDLVPVGWILGSIHWHALVPPLLVLIVQVVEWMSRCSWKARVAVGSKELAIVGFWVTV